MSKSYRNFFYVFAYILLLSNFIYSQVIDGGRGRVCFTPGESIAGTFGTSFEFHEFPQHMFCWSVLGEAGVNSYIEDSLNLNKTLEILVLVGTQLWIKFHNKSYTEVRLSFNAPDLFEQKKTLGLLGEGGILITFSERFWFTLNLGFGTVFSYDNGINAHISIGIIDRKFFSELIKRYDKQ
jgi:hypothetical protein